MSTDVRRVLTAHGRLSRPAETLDADADLFALGLDSLAIVNVMLAVEEAFAVELPDDMLNRRTFASIRALERAIALAAETVG